MAEKIKYIPYGNDEIDYNQFITNADSDLENYIKSQPWSKKRKESFLNAYNKLKSQGITGAVKYKRADGSDGWKINHAGEEISVESERDKQMLGAAADYFWKHMSNIPTKASLEKKKTEDEKKELPKFNNEYFTAKLNQKISNEEFGGSDFEKREFWELDKKGDNGIYSTDIRRPLLADKLENYVTSLEEGKYDFEGGPFSNLDDFKARANAAITALRSGTPDQQRETLRKLGLSYEDYLSDGGDEKVQLTDGRVMSQREFNQLKAKEDAKVEKEKQDKQRTVLTQQRANQLDGYKSVNLSKYKARPLTNEESTVEHLQSLFNKDKWSADEASQINQAFELSRKNGQLVPLSQEELSKLTGSIWNNRKQYLRKINGINGLYYDTLSGQYKKFYKKEQTPQTNFSDVLKQNSTEAKENIYKNSPIGELDSYAYADLISGVADIFSIIDPEPTSAVIAAQIGTAARAYSRSKNTGLLENAAYTTGDTALGLLAAVPVAGDAGLVWRLGRTGIKSLGYVSTVLEAKNLPDSAKAWKKYMSLMTDEGPLDAYKKLTHKEAEDLKSGLMVLLGIKGGIQGHIGRKVTSPINGTSKKMVEVDVNIKGNPTKIQVTPEEAKNLRSGITGKLDKSNTKLRNQASIQKYAKDNNLDVKDIELQSAPGRMLLRNTGMTPTTVSTSGTASPSDFGWVWRRQARFQNYWNKRTKSSGNSFFDRMFHGYRPSVNNTMTPPPTTSSSTTTSGASQSIRYPQPPSPILDIRKPVRLGPYYNKQGGTITNLDTEIKEILKTL